MMFLIFFKNSSEDEDDEGKNSSGGKSDDSAVKILINTGSNGKITTGSIETNNIQIKNLSNVASSGSTCFDRNESSSNCINDNDGLTSCPEGSFMTGLKQTHSKSYIHYQALCKKFTE